MSLVTASSAARHPGRELNDFPERQVQLKKILDEAQSIVAPVWPLQDYVAVNPYQGLANKRFIDARAFLRMFSDCEMLMPLDYYRQRYTNAQFDCDDLAAALDEVVEEQIAGAEVLTVHQLSEWLHGGVESGPDIEHHRQCWSFSQELDVLTGSRWTMVIGDELSKCCSAHYDLGQAFWPSPWKQLSLFGAWREMIRFDKRVELKGLTTLRKLVESLPEDEHQAIGALLERARIPTSHWLVYLLSLAYENPGWSAFTRHQANEAAKRAEATDDFIGLLAIRMAYDCAIAETFDVRVDWLDRLHSPEPMQPASDVSTLDPNSGLVRYVLMRANEIGYRRTVLGGLSTSGAYASRTKGDLGTAESSGHKDTLAQMVFCIDVRSERIRRNLEATSGKIATFGFAGFFGLPFEYVRMGEARGTNQLPVLVDPAMKVYEGVRTPKSSSPTAHGRQLEKKQRIRMIRKLWKRFQTSALSCFAFVESAGLLYGMKLVGRSLRLNHEADGCFDGIDSQNRSLVGPTLEGLEAQGIGLDKQTDLAESILRGTGLTSDLASLVVFCGHASHTENNPLQSGLDCGACAGHSGESNARFAAMLLNNRAIRDGLQTRGLEIPANVHFLAGLHNTTTDEIEFFDTDLVPDSHQGDLRQLREHVAKAAEGTRAERAPTLREHHETRLARRSNDWSEVRPEWGLTGNAAFVIGPRSLTANFNLAGRSFMHSYDADRDPDGKVLEQIMTAPMIVTNWINMQYFASTVDQERFGCGDKTIHNVVGKFGILEGNGGDLRAGLPWQSLHDGHRYHHDPVRLLVVIAARRSAIDHVIQTHENVRDLVKNGWVQLVAVEDGEHYRFAPTQEWKSLDGCVKA